MASTTNAHKMSNKQPAEILDYDFDFTKRLAPSADTISTATVICDNCSGAGTLVLGSTVVSVNVVKQWVSAGISGETYKLTCTAITTAGRKFEQEMYIPCKEL